MRNPLARPRTLGQWLLVSGCLSLVVVCLGVLWYRNQLVGLPKDEYGLLEFCSIWVGYFLIWLVALPGSGAMLRSIKLTSPPALWWMAYWWRWVLLLFQVAVLLMALPLLLLIALYEVPMAR